MKSKLARMLLCSFMAVTLLAGCGSPKVETTPEETPTAQNTGIFTYALGGDTGNTLNTFTADDRWGLMTSNMVASPLYRLDSAGTFVPLLAESMEASADGLVYTLKLKSDLKWSDDTPFTADDVVFTYDTINSIGSSLFIEGQPIKVAKVDDTTVTFTLPAVSASVIEMLSAEIFMAPKHIFEGKSNFDINMLEQTIVGTGPYILEEYKTGQYLKFKANPNYVGGVASIPTVIYKIIDNADTAALALQNKEVDALVALPTQLATFEGNADFTITNYSEGRVPYVRMNRVADNMQNQDYRKGIFYALNRTELMTAAYNSDEFYELGYSFLPPISSYYSEDVEKYDQDIEKAKQLTSGGPTNLKLCYVGEDPAQKKQALTIQAELKIIGINVELAGVDQAAYTKAVLDLESKEYDMFLGGYVMGIDPDTCSTLFSSEYNNMMNFDSSAVNDIFAKGKAELDPEKRKEIYNEAQKLVAEEALFYPLGTNLRSLVTTSRVSGIEKAGLVPVYTFQDTSKLELN